MARLISGDLKKFIGFLEDKGYVSQAPSSKNSYEAYRGVLKRPGVKDTIVIYQRGNGLITVQQKDEYLVNEFYGTGKVLEKVIEKGKLSERDLSLLVEDIKYQSVDLDYKEKREMLQGIDDIEVLRALCLSLL